MGALFRSDDMSLVQLFIQYEAVRNTVEDLGNLNIVEFRDVRDCRPM
jgi:hypothetical protein